MVSLLDRWTHPLDVEDYLALVDPTRSRRPQGVIESVVPLTSTAAAIRIRPPRSWRPHRPGQFVTLGVDVDGRRHHRCYSITSLPTSGRDRGARIEVAVQAVDGGTVSEHLVHRARPGDVVQVDGPSGDFVLPDPMPQRLLFLTGGSGITPVVGMLRWLQATGVDADVVLLHHVRTLDRLMFRHEPERWAGRTPSIRTVLTRTGEGGRHLEATRLERECPDWRQREVFVCGPEALTSFATGHWADAGLAERLHVERFVPQGATTPVGEQGGHGPASVRFSLSDVVTTGDSGTSLLAAAEEAGLAPPAGCRMGICHTCTSRLECGSAVDLRDGRVREAGDHVQLCVTAPLGDVAVER